MAFSIIIGAYLALRLKHRLHHALVTGPNMMTPCERLLADVDQRMEHIASQREEINEQPLCSMLRGHLLSTEVSSRSQLLSCIASLRAAAAATRLDQPTERPMQTNESLQYYLSQSPWDRLAELLVSPAPSAADIRQAVEILGGVMGSIGLVCPDSETLKRASAVMRGSEQVQLLAAETPRNAGPVAPPPKVTQFRSTVANARYNKFKSAERLHQTLPLDQAGHARDQLVPMIHCASPPHTPPHAPCAGPFAAMVADALWQGHLRGLTGPSLDTDRSFAPHPQIRVLPKPSQSTEIMPYVEADRDEEEGEADTDMDSADADDELKKLEASFALAKKAVSKRPAAAKAAGKAKAAVIKKPAASAPKAPAVIKKPAAAAGAVGFDTTAWIKKHVTRADAKAEKERRYFISRTHHKADRALSHAGIDDRKSQLRQVRQAAGAMHDDIHKKD